MNRPRSRPRPLPALLTALALAAVPLAAAVPAQPALDRAQFRTDLRKLWEDHVTWTRLYIVSVAAGLPDQEATAQRLLANQDDLGRAIAPFYGEAAGDRLSALLRDHILGAADLLAAAKAGDSARVDAARAAWYRNGDDIAAFLTGANPANWPLADLQAGMKMHLDMTLREALDRFAGRWADDIRDYDEVHQHILGLADLLSDGIARQFPDRFR
jgi:hypothetical protein